MAYVVWTTSMSVGMPDVDAQHQHFIDLINKTKDAVDANSPRKEQEKVLNDLIGYGRYHFETEEKYFAKYKYPYADEHIAEHAKLLERVIAFYNEFEAGKNVAPELLLFLKEWLATHLQTHDMKYAKYFKNKGYV